MQRDRVHRRLSTRLAKAAWVALAVLAIGGASHLWHHLTDSDCESPDQGASHACSACSALHGGMLAGESQPASTPPPSTRSRFVLPATGIRVAHVAPVGPPRGPPAA
jgi:hypothetical protein